jgi:hypothetical protein
MKKIVGFGVLFFLLLTAVYGQTDIDFVTKIENGTITIARYVGNVKDVIIPKMINGKRPRDIQIEPS